MGYRCLLQMWTVRTFYKGMSIVSLRQWVSYNGTSTKAFFLPVEVRIRGGHPVEVLLLLVDLVY